MALINRKALNDRKPGNAPVKIGNNRTARLAADGTDIFALHGHDIVTYRSGTMTLDPKGYRTPTTAQAMRDFVAQITPRKFSVSFAKGAFNATLGGDFFLPDDNGQIVIQID
jgi:hypothetical protein